MNPGLVVKLRPSGPWRIGPDSGARNRVDVIYHSDSLYSAVTGAMARLGRLEDWLGATARSAAPAVCFSSCFPFLNETNFAVPPRSVWPPASAAMTSSRVRWKSARFVPLPVIRAVLAGRPLKDHWSVDGPSGCLVPEGRPGPFRTAVRWSAAVDRLTGASERHSMACLEFRPGAGLWTVVGFADESARDQWADTVKAAFRLLADSGFGGERSRGWGRSESPEFIEGSLPELIVGVPQKAQERENPAPPAAPVESTEAPAIDVAESLTVEPLAGLATEPAEPRAEAAELAPEIAAPLEMSAAPESPAEESPAQTAESTAEAAEPSPDTAVPVEPAVAVEPADETAEPPAIEAAAEPAEPPAAAPRAASHWLLSLFTPAESDSVDWARGNYTVLARGGRVESPSGSGALKKQIQMVTEGSVLVAAAAPRGSAADVAPDGFAHPVFRAGFALAIPLPEGN
jgi:CRISPR type III-A-associated RAMP protein Csm4